MAKELIDKKKRSLVDRNDTVAAKREMKTKSNRKHFIHNLSGGRNPKECRELSEILKDNKE